MDDGQPSNAPLRNVPYRLLCFLIGLPLAWIPFFLHGPIPQKYDILHIKGAVAVWGWYTARMLIGFWVGNAGWPARWWLRGALCGFTVMLPLTIVSLATPGCGAPCMGWNLTTGTTIGFVVAGLAFVLTGRERADETAPR